MKLDLANRGLAKLDHSVLKEELTTESENEVQILVLDNNSLTKLDGVEKITNLINLSAANNQLVEIRHIARLFRLEYLNLMCNSLTSLDSLKQLKNLVWLNVSGNQIRNIDCLKLNTSLRYIDASDNLIDHLSDLSALKDLEVLNLTGNEIYTLESASDLLPESLNKLYLSTNVIEDLNEVCYLEALENLLHLSINNNPCVVNTLGLADFFNYRPYVLNWCLNLKELDGVEISQKEFLKAEWLYSQGKGRYFSPGQHAQLVEYLIKNCPILTNESIQEDIRLSKILEKKELYSQETNNSLSVNKTVQATVQQPQQKVSTPSSQNQKPIIEQQQQIPPSNQIPQEKQSLIDNIKLSSNESLQNLGRRTDSEEMLNSEMNDTKSNQNAYVDYENRPIKPLDPNMFYKQLSEFSELSSEELEKMKERVISRKIRAKTTETAQAVTKLGSQSSRSQTKKPTRQQSCNNTSLTQHQNSSFIKQQQQKNSKQYGSNSSTLKSKQNPNLSQHRRSKTQEELSLSRIYSQQLRPQSSGISPKRQVSKFITNSSTTPSNRLQKQSKYTIKTAATNNTSNTSLNRVDSFPMGSSKKIASPIQTISPSKPGQKKLVGENKRTMETENEMSLSSGPATTTTRTRSNSASGSRSGSRSRPLTDTDTTTTTTTTMMAAKIIQSSTLREHIEKLQNKRNELRMARVKNFRTLKNEARLLEEQKEMSFYESLLTKTVQAPKILTFEDRCAVKIQAAWRGYYCRNSKFIKPIVMQLKFRKMFIQVVALRSNLQNLKNQHTNLTKFNKDSMTKLSQMIGNVFRPVEASPNANELEIRSRIEPLPMTSTNTNEKSVGYSQLILTQQVDVERENTELRMKCKQLEERCRNLESKITSQKENYQQKKSTDYSNNNNTLSDTTNTSTTSKSNRQTEATTPSRQPKPDIYPALKVRLQKLNERSVALKWNHNPKNALLDLTGYNIYINDEMLATMKPSDKIASIDGMKEEGEYRIYIKSVCGQVESESSNVVITRVKKKHPHADNNKKAAQKTDSDNPETDNDNENYEEEDFISHGSPSKSSDEKHGIVGGAESIEKLLENFKPNNSNEAQTSNPSPRLSKKPLRQNVALENIFKTTPTSQQQISVDVSNSVPNTVPFQSNYQIESSSSFTVGLAANNNSPLKSEPKTSSSGDKDKSKDQQLKPDAQSKQVKLNSPGHNTSDHSVDNNHVKYSNNEPNFSKTLSTTSGSTGRGSPLRRSMSFSDHSNEDSN